MQPDIYLFGFSTWKHPFIKPFLPQDAKLFFINPLFSRHYLAKARSKGLSHTSVIYIWGKKPFTEVEAYAKEHGIKVCRVEDGFIRSVGLGSDLTQPYSLVVDTRGIYFDPSQESDLEDLLNFHKFTAQELTRAKHLREVLIEKKLSKYNNYENTTLDLPQNRKVILVPGQVEDDASIRFGAEGMSNLQLLKEARLSDEKAYIIYKPHPDVLAGNRVGSVSEQEGLTYCDQIVTEVSLDSVLCLADEVHTMTSLVGFEAMMRGITVYTYGMPFYAGWGLTHDKQKCTRRKREVNLDELTVAALLLYPNYIDPNTNLECEVEVTMMGLESQRQKLADSRRYRILTKARNLVSRKSQQLLRFIG